MNGGNLSDQQLKEFDAYLSGDDKSTNGAKLTPAMDEPKPFVAAASTDNGMDQLVKLHKEKVAVILGLLDKIDAKSHKDIVADLVDEMQYQKSIIKREEEQGANLRKLITLANEATK